MRRHPSVVMAVLTVALSPALVWAQALPFNSKVEVFRTEEGDVMAFALYLEQPFLAEEFEKSNYLRLTPLDGDAYLVYPKETRFEQKHAEFFGRLRGKGEARLKLSYEIVSENLDGSRKVDVREAIFEVAIPTEKVGPETIYHDWAQNQNAYFIELLSYYPDETFFQYVLLQSGDRYGVTPPPIGTAAPTLEGIEEDLYYTFSGSLAIQKSLQRQTLGSGPSAGDLSLHVSQLRPPAIRSLPYRDLLEERRKETPEEPCLLDVAKLVPRDQYLMRFRSMKTARELLELAVQWGEPLLRLYTERSRAHDLGPKFEDQLCLPWDSLEELFDQGAIVELAVTGSDIFIGEGADLTIFLKVERGEAVELALVQWLATAMERFPTMVEREFNYRGHKVTARYVPDRTVSSFVVRSGDYLVVSNSHRSIRKIVDTVVGEEPNLFEADDYRYLSSIHPPSDAPESAYLYASDAFLRYLISPELKISEKRRLQCFNNLVMLNNASLFYRMEQGTSPTLLSDLEQGRFIDPGKLVCPHGGAYAFDVEHDTCTCSLHNRIKYLTPNAELTVLNVSARERDEYNRYRERYESFWKSVFNPIAARLTVGPQVQIELAVLPFLNSEIYQGVRSAVDDNPLPLDTRSIARSAVASLAVVPGREKVAAFLRELPGVVEVLQMDPTLTDLSWIGDSISIHLCDDSSILEIDPMRLRQLSFFGDITPLQQSIVAAAVYGTSLPVYVTLDVEDREKARRLLHQLASRIFLKQDQIGGLETRLDAYRLPDHEGHEVHVVTYQLYALKVRLYLSLVGNRLVAATALDTLRGAIEAAKVDGDSDAREAHALLRWNHAGLGELKESLRTYWAEKSRAACHRNIMSIYNLVKLYETPVAGVDKLSEAKYGVKYFCPDGGVYRFDDATDRVACSVHGNRQDARQNDPPEGTSAFSSFIEGIRDVVITLRFTDECLLLTGEIDRAEK